MAYLLRLSRVLSIRPSDYKTLGSGTRGEWEISGREERIVEWIDGKGGKGAEERGVRRRD